MCLSSIEFNGEHYLQKFGTAIGSKLAPAYANTFMGKLEAKIVANSPHKPLHYRRYTDDIFLIWPHSEERLKEFITHMNKVNKFIQFMHEKKPRGDSVLQCQCLQANWPRLTRHAPTAHQNIHKTHQ